MDRAVRARRWLVRLVGPIIAIVALIGVGIHQYGSPGLAGPASGPDPGLTAPDFTARLADGSGSMRLSDLRGKPVVLNFFASWCGPCKKEAAELEAAHRRAKDQVSFVGVSFQDAAGAVRAFAREHDQTFPLLVDGTGDVGRSYRVRGLPTTFFIRADGVVRYVVKGPLTREFIALEIEAMSVP